MNFNTIDRNNNNSNSLPVIQEMKGANNVNFESSKNINILNKSYEMTNSSLCSPGIDKGND